jgi:hypothetical protein
MYKICTFYTSKKYKNCTFFLCHIKKNSYLRHNSSFAARSIILGMQHKDYNLPPSSFRQTAQKLASYALCYTVRSDLTPQKWREKVRPVLWGTKTIVPKQL